MAMTMNALQTELVFIENDRPVTDSLMVAEVFGKEHRRVMQDIRELPCSEEFRLHHFVQSSYTNQQGREMPKYFATQQGFTLLVMGYTGQRAMEFKERYIAAFDRMRVELERQSYMKQFNLPANYKEALVALVVAEEEKEQLLIQAAEDAPKVEAFDIYMDSSGSHSLTDVAKSLGMTAMKMCGDLRERKILLNMPKNSPASRYVKEGYFVVKNGVNRNTNYAFNQTRVTPEGVEFIRQTLEA